jgi:hypothetical protein
MITTKRLLISAEKGSIFCLERALTLLAKLGFVFWPPTLSG